MTDPTDDSVPEGSRIKSVEMTIRLLHELAAAGEAVGVSDLARRVGESKARIHRHLLTLRDAGFLDQEAESDRYRLGWTLFELGQAAAAQSNIAAIATPALRALCEQTRLTVLLGQRTGDEVIMSHTFESENMIAVTARRGLRVPAHGSAAGRVMLAFAPPEDQARILGKKLVRLSPNTPTKRADIEARLALIRERHYEHAESESQFGVNSIAVPILNAASHLVAVVSLIGTQSQVSIPPSPTLLKPMMACAREITKALGTRGA